MKMTDAQAWALQAIADGYGEAPSMLGERMMERPGATARTQPYKAQGYGWMGGAMMERLRLKGWVETGGWPTRAALTHAGRARLTEVAAHLRELVK